MPVFDEYTVFNFYFMLLVVILISLCLYLVYSCGYLSNIEVEVQKPPFQQVDVAYKFVTGPYLICKQLMSEVKKLAPYLDLFVIYQEDPKKYAGSMHYPFMDKSLLNLNHPWFSGQTMSFTVGAIVRSNKQDCNKRMCQILCKNGYIIANFPSVENVLMAAFPFVNQLSLYAGIKRVYPKMRRLIETKRLCAYPAMEVYTCNRIYFIAPLSQQTHFYVPEALPEYCASDSDSSNERNTPIYRSKSNSVNCQILKEKSGLAVQMLKKHCMCDNDRSQSCDYCKRNL